MAAFPSVYLPLRTRLWAMAQDYGWTPETVAPGETLWRRPRYFEILIADDDEMGMLAALNDFADYFHLPRRGFY